MRILAVAPHPDDVELGCGGSLAKYSQQGHEVFSLILTLGELGKGDPIVRIKESQNGGEVLGIKELSFARLTVTEISLTTITHHNIEIIEKAVRKINPTRVFICSPNDSHQVHAITSKCTLIACRKVPQLLYYQTPSTMIFNPVYFEDITDFLDIKIQAFKAHVSQYHSKYIQWIKGNAWINLCKVSCPSEVKAIESFEIAHWRGA